MDTEEKTKREIELIGILSEVLNAWKTEANWGDGIDDNHMPIYNRAMRRIDNLYISKDKTNIQKKENMCEECGQECCDYVKEINEELAAYKLLLDSAHMILLNANDFFGWACADAVELDVTDLSWVIPIVKKYGVEGVEACMTYIRQCFPVKEIRTERFEKAYDEIEELKPKVYSEEKV